ncbi:uncharacterized protein [Primulina huaijiensis]|uniref:uncharacterized protein n=1 Tax=Primulina huaijiensis TaxID=1492673 RepID=UPI003CC754BB
MALTFSQFQVIPHTLASTDSTRQSLYVTQKPATIFSKKSPNFTQFASKSLKFTTILRASQEDENTTATNEKSILDPSGESQPEKYKSGEMTDLGKEIKAAMKEREGQKGESGFLDGVAQEIREIEWPAFNKVLGTTGVVLGVIAGSSVVLLTVNAVLAELSDRVFAGRGVQDFFG